MLTDGRTNVRTYERTNIRTDGNLHAYVFLLKQLRQKASICDNVRLDAISVQKRTTYIYDFKSSVHLTETIIPFYYICTYYLSYLLLACDRRYMQRCDTCSIGSRCKSMLIGEEMLYVAEHCKELCERNTSCQAAEYHPANSSCKLYDCTLMNIAIGYTSVVFRKSCSQGITQY